MCHYLNVPYQTLCFIATVEPFTIRLITEFVIFEGNSVDITCTSSAEPYPIVFWTLRDQPTPFNQTDVTTERRLTLSEDFGGLELFIRRGQVDSTLHIVNAQYPADNGVYMCTGMNYHAGENMTHSEIITVHVQGKDTYTDEKCLLLSTILYQHLRCWISPLISLWFRLEIVSI